MIQFFVNDAEIVLPEGFSFTLKEENPLLTNNGEFTLDITVSLLNPQNARAFGFINRLNNNNPVLNAAGKMLRDGHTSFGQIVVTKNTDVDVTFQFVGGNSELNYLCNNNLKLQDLSFGVAKSSALNFDDFQEVVLGSYPDYNYTCAMNVINGTMYNQRYLHFEQENGQWKWVWKYYLNGIERYNIQPYLKYYIDKIFELLGYEIDTDNSIDDPMLNRIIMYAPTTSLNFNDFLPDWTVIAFLESIEKMFNLFFVINKFPKKVQILNTKKHYDTAGFNKVPDYDVLDAYEQDVVKSELSTLNYSRVKYNLDSPEWFKYACISDEVLNFATVETYASFSNLASAYQTQNQRAAAYGTLKIFHITDTGNWYIIAGSPGNYIFNRINMLKEINTDPNASEVSLDIIPIRIDSFLAVVDSELINSSVAVTNINELIKDDSPLEKKYADKIRVGICYGMAEANDFTHTFDANYMFNRVVLDCYKDGIVTTTEELNNTSELCSLKLNGLHGMKERYYDENLNIDYTKKFVFKFRNRSEYNIRNYYNIRGGRYICTEIEKQCKSDSDNQFVTGYFLKV